MGEVDLDFKWAISLRKFIFIIKNHKLWQKFPSHQPSRNQFSKASTASSMLNLNLQSEDCLAFFLSGAGLLTFLNQISQTERKNYLENSICKCYSDQHLHLCSEVGRNYFGVSSTVYDELMLSGKPPVLKFGNRLCSPGDEFQMQNDKLS